MRDVGPAANSREAVCERFDIAGDIVEPGNLGREPFVGDVAAFADVAVKSANHSSVMHRPNLAEVGKAANRPEAPRLLSALGDDRRVFGNDLQYGKVDRLGRRTEERIVALFLEARDQRPDVAEVEVGVAPIDGIERAEAVFLDRVDFFVAESAAVLAEAERAEASILLMTSGAARDLRHLCDREAPVAPAVELFEAGEGDVAHIEIEPHSDRIGGYEIIDLAALEHRDLRVPC